MSTTQAAIKTALDLESKDGAMAVELAKLTNNSVNLTDGEKPQKAIEQLSLPVNDEFLDDQSDVKNTAIVKEGLIARCRTKCCTRDPNKKPAGFESNPNLRIK